MTERLHFHFSLSCIGEGNGNPLQCSCLENPRDGGAWWAAVYGVAQSRTRLKRLSSSSSNDSWLSIFSCAHKPLFCFPVGLFSFSTPLWLHLHFLNRPISLIPANTLLPGTINTEAKDLSDLLPEPHTASLKSISFSHLRKSSLTPKIQRQSTNRADSN